MTKTARIALIALLGATFTLGASAHQSASASASSWAKEHPRRAQVNKRLENQNDRIKEERKEGDITKAQAQNLHREDRKIRQEERDMASMNGGHITKQEQKTLNQQENKVSKQIGK